MINYKFINKSPETQKNLKAITELGKENWLYQNELDGILIFYKKVTTTAETKVKLEKAGKEFEEFIKAYREINNNGSYDERLIAKYHKALTIRSHTEIMENLKQYKLHLEITKKPPLQVGTYINQSRFLDKWSLVKEISVKWLDDLFIQRGLEKQVIENVLQEIKAREVKNNREITNGVANNLIDYVQGK